MSYLLDTSIAIELRDAEPSTVRWLRGLRSRTAISIVTRVELKAGLVRDAADEARFERLDAFPRELPILPFAEAEADAYQRILQHAGYSRRKLIDRMIAAQALVHGATLATRNPDDCRDAPGLDLLSW